MAADVSRQIKSEAKSGLITRDFLGGCSGIDSKELDLDLHVPIGWEKRLDLKVFFSFFFCFFTIINSFICFDFDVNYLFN